MKTSILISIIATCMGLRSLANVIPPSIRELSCGATFRRYNMARAIPGRVISDESGIGQAGIAPAFARRKSIDSTSLLAPFKRDAEKGNDDKDRRDIRYLNHALFIKRFLCSFFERGLSRYSQEDFIRAGYPDWVRGRYTQMLDVAKVHRDFLESAITAAGSERVRPCNVEFGDNDVRAFIDQSAALATISASAFTGSMHYFNNRAYTTASASILAVEGRHAAWINSAVREENPSNHAFETPLTPNHVATLLSKFIDFDSCPAENRDLLPEGYHPHPRLYLSPRLVPGEEAEISFPYPELGQGERLYAAFMAGAETIFARISERERGKDDGSGSRSQGKRNSNDQFPGGWPSNDNRNGNRNKNAGDDHGDENNHHDENHNRDDGRKNENDHHFDKDKGDKEKDDKDRKDENDRNDHNGKDGNGHNRMDDGNYHRMDGDNHNGKDRNGHNRMDENNRDRMDENNRNRKDEKDRNRSHENDHNGMHRGNNVNSNRNFASSGFSTPFDNNNRRFFVEIPRDLATKGSIFIVIVKGRDNIGEVRLDEGSTVAGPAFANFPFDAWNNPISH